jgi:hypothetical protein
VYQNTGWIEKKQMSFFRALVVELLLEDVKGSDIAAI